MKEKKAKCPNCGVMFSLPLEWSDPIDCPDCHKTFMPIDVRLVALEQRREVSARITEYFRSISAPLAQKICNILTTDTPVPGRGGYLGREKEIENVLNEAVRSRNANLTDALLKSFVDVHDWCFCHKLISKIQISKEAEEYLVHAVMAAPHLGGQSGDYFHLLTILAKKRKEIREWCEKVKMENKPNSILAENMELVLAGRA